MKRVASICLALWLAFVAAAPASAEAPDCQTFGGSDPATGWSWSETGCWHTAGQPVGNDGTYTFHMDAYVYHYAPDGTLASVEYLSDKWHQTQVVFGTQHVVHRDSQQNFLVDGVWHRFRSASLWVDGRQIWLRVWIDGKLLKPVTSGH